MLNKLATLSQKISPGLHQIIGNIGWLFAERILQMSLGLLVGVWVARYLGPNQFGLLNYIFALIGLLAPFSHLGLKSIVMRDIIREPDQKEEILGTSFALSLLGGTVTWLLVVGSISLLRPGDTLTQWLAGITALGLMIIQSSETIDFWFESQVQSKNIVLAGGVPYVLMSLVKVALIQVRAPLIAFAWALPAEVALNTVGRVIVYKVHGYFLKAWRYSLQRAKSLLKESWPLIISGMVIEIYMRIDQLMLGQMMGDDAVGVYSVAVKLSELWYFIPAAIINSVSPSIMKAKATSEQLYYERIQKLFNLLSVLSYAVAIPATFLSNLMVTLLYGKQYVDAGPMLAILMWTGLFVALGMARSQWIIAEGFTKFSALTTSLGAVINIVLNFILIPPYGGIGASIATVIAQIVASYASHAVYPKTRGIFVRQTKAILLFDLIKKRRLS